MIEKEKIPELIDRFTNRELTGRELTEFLELLRNDPVLRAEVNLDTEIDEILKQHDLIAFRKTIIEAMQDKPSSGKTLKLFLLAAAFLIVAAISVIVYLVIGKGGLEKRELQTSVHDTVRKFPGEKNPRGPEAAELRDGLQEQKERNLKADENPRDKNLIAANYEPFPAFESLVGTHVRSGAFRLITPVDSARFIDEKSILFSWETGIKKELILRIMNNHGLAVFISDPLKVNHISVPVAELKEGLFYYKITGANQIIHFGKFSIGTRN